ncbi:brix domain-containing protein [Cavenderia fasciculata]|uniref:Brix domain-containing protein n=1 Tax=Cavenderia fasciculata TaxID=261658 RepID=F4PUS2_CACFS|nr:brix domain-containing protein [Cavenderia fasciculata]EGG21091.1 brix domain-containing protein [Cavenderia fasciculata]|eukprot:XP_004358941.1 brix domain-containing protein [Cavenderia fasciculata]
MPKPSIFSDPKKRKEREKQVKKKAASKSKGNEEEVAGPTDAEKAPVTKSMVFKRGKVSKSIKQLIVDFRKVMEPNTATRLEESNTNTIKDYLHVASMYHVSHFVSFTNTDISPYMAVAKLPRGPTLTFKINEFSTINDVGRSKLKPSIPTIQDFIVPPLVVLNGFSKGTPQMEIMSTILQNMFPSINIDTIQLGKCKRVILFNYNKTSNLVEFRHYKIKLGEVGISKSIKRVLQAKTGDLGDLDDISEYILSQTGVTESDYEDAQDGKIDIDHNVLRKGTKSNTKSIRLTELGPRLTLDLIKVEDNLYSGEVLFHKYYTKTEEQLHEQKIRLDESKLEKSRRKERQEENLKAKEEEEKRKQKKKADKDQRRKDRKEGKEVKTDLKRKGRDGDDDEKMNNKKKNKEMLKSTMNEDRSDDDDEDWYRKEVGEDPDEGFKAQKKSKYDHKKNKH